MQTLGLLLVVGGLAGLLVIGGIFATRKTFERQDQQFTQLLGGFSLVRDIPEDSVGFAFLVQRRAVNMAHVPQLELAEATMPVMQQFKRLLAHNTATYPTIARPAVVARSIVECAVIEADATGSIGLSQMLDMLGLMLLNGAVSSKDLVAACDLIFVASQPPGGAASSPQRP